MVSIPAIEPVSFSAGDTVTWSRSLADYPASAGWVLSYNLRNAEQKIDITASASGADHVVTVPAATSLAWVAGEYAWAAFVTKAAERYEVGRGVVSIRANMAAAGPVDMRSHAELVLANVRAVLEQRASRDQEEYSIEGRSLKRTPLADLVMLERRYARLVTMERAAAGIAAGRPNPYRSLVRFTG